MPTHVPHLSDEEIEQDALMLLIETATAGGMLIVPPIPIARSGRPCSCCQS
jgi:hypothetical protein